VTAQERLAQLRAERAELAATRTREDVRQLTESWLASALARVNGATNYVLNGHIGPAEVQAVLSEYLLESPALIDSITAKVTAQVELTNKQKASKEKRLDEQIAKATAEVREEAKAKALAEIEEQFGGVAA
jgi:hypothetical protein